VEGFPVSIQVDASALSASPHASSARAAELPPIWRFFGCDEPNYAYLPDGSRLLATLGGLGDAQVYFRTHNLLTSGDGTPALKWGSTNAYSEDADGRPVYDWQLVDRIFDTYLERRVKPYVQVGFMPRDLSRKPEPYQHHWSPFDAYSSILGGWAHPPKDWDKWHALVREWVLHALERYGKAEVESWYWEPWNEANILYWQGTPAEYHQLYDYTVDAIRGVLPTARVGGPDSAGADQWLRDFLEHCLRGKNYRSGAQRAPLDFVAFHAKGKPEFVDGHVRMGIAQHLRTIDDGFGIVASFPELAGIPVIIGESDPEGCAACQGPALGYRNGSMYSSYTAASFARKLDLAERHGVRLEGALTWAFEFENQPWFAGFRALASNGVALPVLNVFRMLAQLRGARLPVHSTGAVPLERILSDGVRQAADVHALASGGPDGIQILIWHYHDADVAGPAAHVRLSVAGAAWRTRPELQHFRVDAELSNAYTAWQRLGCPAQPSAAERELLEHASQLAQLELPPEHLRWHANGLELELTLPRQGVSLLRLPPVTPRAR
jgi:xylan 1,4-beta-xylosidase